MVDFTRCEVHQFSSSMYWTFVDIIGLYLLPPLKSSPKLPRIFTFISYQMFFLRRLGLLRGNITFKVCTESSPNLRPIFPFVLVGFLRSIEISATNKDTILEAKTVD